MQGIQSCDVRVGSNTNCCEMTVNSPEAKTVNFSLGVFIYSSNNTYTCRYRRNVSPPGFSAFICSLYWARIRSIQSYQRESRSPEFILTARFIALLLDCETHVCVYNSIWGIWHPSAALLSNRDESSESSAVLNWTSWLQPRLFWMTSQREGVLIDSCSSALRWLCLSGWRWRRQSWFLERSWSQTFAEFKMTCFDIVSKCSPKPPLFIN